MNQQSTLVYKCPHCQEKVEVGDEMLGQVVNCPKCERPFRVEAPPSFPISDDEAGSVLRKGGATQVSTTADHEHVLLSLHPAVFRRRIFQTLGAFLLIIGGLVCAVWGAGTGNPWLGFGGLAAAIVGGLDLAYWWFKSLYVTLTVTSRRTILRKGLFSKSTSEVNHDDVRNIQVDQSVVQRLLNIGDLLISSAGQDIVEIRARAIYDPEAVASLVRERQDCTEDGPGASARPPEEVALAGMGRIARPPRLRYPAGTTRLRYHWDWLRSGYLFVPSAMVVLAFGLVFAAIKLDAYLYSSPWQVSDWYTQGGPDETRTILGMIAGSMITIVGIVYSIAMVNLTLASDQFGPRLIRTFMTDVGTQVTLGAFLATFVYSVLVLLAIESGTHDASPGPDQAAAARTGDPDAVVSPGLAETTEFVPVVSLWLGVGLAMICLALLIYFIHHVAQAIQAPNVIDSVARELERSIRRHFPEDRDPVEPLSSAADREGLSRDLPPDFEAEARPVLAASSGYLQFIDIDGLLGSCAERDLVTRLEYRPGEFVIAGGHLALAWPPDRVDEEAVRRLRGAFVIGVQRTPPEDVEFSISQLVEVAVRALANNDPFTSINCVDRLGAAMCLLVGRKMPPRRRYDREGRLRVVARSTRFGGIINTAFDQIRQYGLGNAALTIRLLEVIALIASRVDNLTDGASLLRQAVMIERGSRRAIEEEYDRHDIADRFQDILNQLGLKEVAEVADRANAPWLDTR